MITERKSVYSASNGTDRLKKGDVRERERERWADLSWIEGGEDRRRKERVRRQPGKYDAQRARRGK